jgi:hypothetical protein
VKLIERILSAINQNRVEYWGHRPGNLPRAAFDETFTKNPTFDAKKMEERVSGDGVHGLDGDDYVFSGKVTVKGFDNVGHFYLKFFFWKKRDAKENQGIEVQSFKPWREFDV